MLIGITGGIGSGKSFVAAQIKQLGYPVYDTDKEAKRLIIEDTQVRSQIEELFGKEVFRNNQYQTLLVAQQVFTHPTLLRQLNAIVHPAVIQDVCLWHQTQQKHIQYLPDLQIYTDTKKHLPQRHHDLPCFVESAILYESGLYKICQHIILVTASEEVRIQRILRRDYPNCQNQQDPDYQKNVDAIRARIHAQTTPYPTQQQSHFIITNNQDTPIATQTIKDILHRIYHTSLSELE